MSWNLMIAGVVLAVVLVNIVVFKVFSGKKNIFVRTLKFICLLCFIPVAIAILLPNVFWILSPLTPAIHGKVVDAATGNGIPGVNILVAWNVSSVTVGGGSRQPYRNYRTVSDANGEFKIPRTIKAFSIAIPPFGSAEYGGISILAYDFDHENVIGGAGDSVERIFVLKMNPIKNDSEYLANIQKIVKEIYFQIRDGSKRKKELSRLVEGYRLFEKKYPQSKIGEEILFRLAHIYEVIGDREAKIKIWQELLEKYPSGKHSEYALFDMEDTKREINKNERGRER